jgi:cell division protein ZapE
VAWFDFGRLCGAPLAHADYLELAQAHDTLLLSGVPRMTPQQGDAARRFVWLVDVCYDEGVRLILAADAPADELYPGGPNSAEFARAVSRLHEMGAPDPGHRHPPQRALTLPVPFSGPGSP